jgi:hypothetical protein
MTSLRLALCFLILPLTKILPVGCVALFFAVRVFRGSGVGLADGTAVAGMESAGLVFDFGNASAGVLFGFLAVPG